MLWFIKSIALLLDGAVLQFLRVFGAIAFATAVFAGAMRGPLWTAALVAAGFGLISSYFPNLELPWLEKASSSSERFGFVLLVYFVIAAGGYLVGRYGRHLLDMRRFRRQAP